LTVPLVTAPVREHSPIEAAERIIRDYRTKPEIRHGYSAAYYAPLQDYIAMPNPEQFKSAEDYYSVLAHECIHSTGAESRLNRKGVALSQGLSPFGSATYSFEELVAECGACFICSEAGIANNLQNSASYVKGWLERLRNDSKLVVHAAAAASKAADYILNRLPAPQATGSEQD
jgi:antirestriction protein ArdC